MEVASINLDYTPVLPPPISEKEDLDVDLSASIQLLSNYCDSLGANIINLSACHEGSKQQLVRTLSAWLLFPSTETTYHKTCGGHDIRVSEKKYYSSKKAKKECLKTEEQWAEKNNEARQFKWFKAYRKREKKAYDLIRVQFVHVDNHIDCDYPAIPNDISTVISVLSVLD